MARAGEEGRSRRAIVVFALGAALPAVLLGLGWLLASWRERDRVLDAEEQVLARSADAVRAAIDESLEELRRREDARPFYLYARWYTPPDVLALGDAVAVSPLAGDPEDPRIIGYFQLDPGGRLRSPHEDARRERVERVLREGVQQRLAPLATGEIVPTAVAIAAAPPTPEPPAPRPVRRARPVAPPITTTRPPVPPTPSEPPPQQAPPTQAAVGIEDYGRNLYTQMQAAQAGDPQAQQWVQQAPRYQPPSRRNVGDDNAQRNALAIDNLRNTTDPPAEPIVLPPREAAPRSVDATVLREAPRTPRQRPVRAAPQQVAAPVVTPETDDAPDASDAADYTPMELEDDGATLVLRRTVSHGGATSVQGVVLDREAMLRAWLPEVVQRHAVAGLAPRILRGAERGDCALVRPASDLLRGVSLCFPPEALRAERAELDRTLAGQTALLALLLVVLGVALLAQVRAARRAAELARQRSAFVAAVSHELRTPLTVLRMHGEMLRDGLVAEGKQARFHAEIAQESERLARLVDNVLEIARLDAGKRPVRLREADLGEQVRALCEQQRAFVEARGFQLVVDAPSLRASFDAQAVEQIVVNLLENAVKYGGGEERSVRVRVAAEEGRAVVHVSDRGVGIPAAERERVFERFHRVERPGEEHVVGTGLGLALVRDLARMHGGDAIAVPRSDGPGLDVRVKLGALAVGS